MGGIVSSIGDAVGGIVGGVADAVGSVAKVAAPVAAAVFGGPALAGAFGATAGSVGAGMISGALGGAVSTAINGGSLGKNMLAGGLLGGVASGVSSAMGAPLGSGGTLSQSQFASLAGNPAAIQAYVDAGMISPSMLSGASNAFTSLPIEAQQAYINAGYSPAEIGAAVLQDSGGLLSQVRSAYDASKIGQQLFGTPGASSGNLLGTTAGLLGSYLQGTTAKDAATTSALAQIEAAKIAADAAKFRPVGVTTRFGSSNFGYDANGNLISAGYNVSPELKAQQDALMAASGGMLNQFTGSQAATAPMGAAGQRAMQLGQGYLQTDPQAQAAQYMAEQQALLAPYREREFAALQNKLQQQGRLGLATGGTSTGLMASNPEMESFYNAQRMQDLNLAAQATQGGQQYAKFGADMVGAGGGLLEGMYGVQSKAYNPYQTAIGGVSALEAMGQQPMDIGINIGAKGAAAGGNAGQLYQQGMINAAMTSMDANKISPLGTLLKTGGQVLGGMTPQQQYQYDPYTGQRVSWGI